MHKKPKMVVKLDGIVTNLRGRELGSIMELDRGARTGNPKGDY